MTRAAITKSIFFSIFALLLATLVLASSVTTSWSGISPSSHKYTFRFDPANPDTTIPNLIETDLIVVQYGSSTRNPPERSFFLKNRLGNDWTYDIKGVRSNLHLTFGQPANIDLDNDGAPDLAMTWSKNVGNTATFVFSAPMLAAATINDTPLNTTPEMTLTPDNALTGSLGDAVNGSNGTIPAAAKDPADLGVMTGSAIGKGASEKNSVFVAIGIGAVIIAAIVGVILMTRRKGGKSSPSEKPSDENRSHKRKHDDEPAPRDLPKIIE